jgi:hypothetical protein
MLTRTWLENIRLPGLEKRLMWARSSLAAVQHGPSDPPKSVINVFGPYLTVDLTPCCLAASPEADVGPYCSFPAM